MRAPAHLAVVCAAAASVATSAPEDGVGPDAGPELARYWRAFSESHLGTLELEPGDSVTYALEARLEGDLHVLEEDHDADVAIYGPATGAASGPTSLTIEVVDDAGVVIAETLRWQGESDFYLPFSFPTEACPRQRGERCTYEVEVTFAADEASVELEWEANPSAHGTLETPARVSVQAVVEAEPL